MNEEVKVFDIVFQVGIGNLLVDYGFDVKHGQEGGGTLSMWLDRDREHEVIAYCDGRVFAAFPSDTILTVEWDGVMKSCSFNIVNGKLVRTEVETPKHYDLKPFADINRNTMMKLVKQLKAGKPTRLSSTGLKS